MRIDKIDRGVSQDCILSLYVENYIHKALENTDLVGKPISNLRYADHTVIITDNFKNQQFLLDRINSEGKKYGYKIDIMETKYMIISRIPPEDRIFYVDYEPIKRV